MVEVEVERTPLDGVLVLTPVVHLDDRGFFLEAWRQDVFDEAVGAHTTFVQDNHSRSMRGVLRGLHYQLPPHAQGKLVRCTAGALFDVAVDIRRASPTFGRWFGVELTAANHRQLWVPPGFAHGFLALADDTHIQYKATAVHAPASDRAIAHDDPTIAIQWPGSATPVLSDKDRAAPPLDSAEVFEPGWDMS